MNYIVSSEDASFDNLENLYTAPLKTVSYKSKVATLAFFLIVSSMNEEVYGEESYSRPQNMQTTEFVESWREPFSMFQSSGVQLEFNQENYTIFPRQVSALWQRQESLNKLRKSFYANFEDQTDMNLFSSLFNSMAVHLSQLKIEDAFVDVSKKKGLIDFNPNSAAL